MVLVVSSGYGTCCSCYWPVLAPVYLTIKKKEVSMNKKYTIALLYTRQGSFHTKAYDAFIAAAEQDPFFVEHCTFKTYEPHAMEPLLTNQLAKSIVDEEPDLIVSFGALLSRSVVSATRARSLDIPVVFIGVSNAVELGLVNSLESTGNNVTGVATAGDDLNIPYELFAMLKEDLKKILLPYYVGEGGLAEATIRRVHDSFAEKGVVVRPLPILSIGDVDHQVRGALGDSDTVMFLEGDKLESARSVLINICNRYKRTLFALDLTPVAKGAAFGYGVDPTLPGKAGVTIVKKVLQGALPSELPIQLLENSRRFLINEKALQEQGATIRPELMQLLKTVSFYREEA